MTSYILDTHALIWLVEGDQRFSQNVYDELMLAPEAPLYISAISIWEIATLVKKGRIVLSEPPLQWVQEVLKKPRFILAQLSPEIAIESCFLPSEIHGDPADRLIAATARILHSTLITKDRKLIEYSQLGYLKVLAL